MTSPVRERSVVDYYAVLGVDPGASGDEIARAFRTRAKRTHPDAVPTAESAGDFKELAAAYTVLSDHRRRREYDRRRASTAVVRLAPPVPPRPGAAPARRPWSRRRCWTTLVAGVLVAVLGAATAFFTWHWHDVDAARRRARRARRGAPQRQRHDHLRDAHQATGGHQGAAATGRGNRRGSDRQGALRPRRSPARRSSTRARSAATSRSPSSR